MHAAIEYAIEHKLNENHRVVVVLADHLRNYITKFVTKEWMIEKGFYELSELADESHRLKGV